MKLCLIKGIIFNKEDTPIQEQIRIYNHDQFIHNNYISVNSFLVKQISSIGFCLLAYQMPGNYQQMPPQQTIPTQQIIPQQGQYPMPTAGQPSTPMYSTSLPPHQPTVRSFN